MTAVTTDGARTDIEQRDCTERSFFVILVAATPFPLATTQLLRADGPDAPDTTDVHDARVARDGDDSVRPVTRPTPRARTTVTLE